MPKSDLAAATTYLKNHWDALVLCTSDGRLPIDNNDTDVWAYLKDILDRILAGCTDWPSLRADAWKSHHPEAVRAYRVDERRDAIDRRRLRHARLLLATKTK